MIMLDQGWQIQSSAKVKAGGEAVSTAAFKTEGWYPATMPSTVLAALVQNKVYPDPYFGMNLRSIPGTAYRIGTNFSKQPMPKDSPFRDPWWFRKEFAVTQAATEQVWLNFDGINYKANIWLNGKQVAGSAQVAGAYRTYEFNITGLLRRDRSNILAVEVAAPEPNDLALNWVDWNPMPPDKNMGIWRDVYLKTSGPVTLRYPQVITKLDLPALDRAYLTVSADLYNPTDRLVKARFMGRLESSAFAHEAMVAPGETIRVIVTPQQCACLDIDNPRLWWPVHTGPQNLYDLNVWVEVDGKVSDQETIRFGIRDVSSELTDKGHRVFMVNGRRILIRGGGWAQDMFLRPSLEREIAEIRYVKDMNLNTIRFEGKMETRRFLEMCDREGILVIAGWCCCDIWEEWDKWDKEDVEIAAASLRDQLRRIRNHPSILTWWYGSDGPPPAHVEERYLAVLREHWPYPYQSSATAKASKLGEPTGLRMTGPYEYVPPVYWYVDKTRGGAYSFNTETSPGPAVPPVESLRKMLPEEHMWPIDEFWNFHAGGGAFRNINVFTEAVNARYGKAANVEDYALKSQAMAYDGQRAMFESYARNKYLSTGVIQWMMNNAWPSLIWHLYDYYLRPAGGYFGTKKACEPVHVQYSLDDASVVVVNGTYRELSKLRVTAKVYNLDMSERLAREAVLDAAPDSVSRAFSLPRIEGLSTTYFLKLNLEDPLGKRVSSNFYWLSTKPDLLDEEKATWFYTPQKAFADYTDLSRLPKVDLKLAARSEAGGEQHIVRVTLENPSRSLVFLVRLKVVKGRGGEEVLPVLWEDNYVSLIPGERRDIAAAFEAGALRGASPFVEVQGWNVIAKSVPARR